MSISAQAQRINHVVIKLWFGALIISLHLSFSFHQGNYTLIEHKQIYVILLFI